MGRDRSSLSAQPALPLDAPGATSLLRRRHLARRKKRRQEAIDQSQASWRRVVGNAIALGIPMPAIGAALSYYDGYRSARLPANLLQAQRDYFGAHTYERVDKARGDFFHTNWTGRGGSTAASTYVV